MKKIFLATALLSLLSRPVFSQPAWNVYSSDVSFKIKNAGLNVNGKLSGLKAEIKFSPEHLASSSLKATVEVATIKTGIGKRDKDLQEGKYFDAGKYKLIEMSSVKIYKKGNGYAGMFNITIKGVTKQQEIPFQFTRTEKNGDFKSDFSIKRTDYGVGSNGGIMGDEIKVSIDVKAKEE